MQIHAAFERVLGFMPPFSRQKLSLVPSAAIASRDLVTVIAIMTFLAALTGGAAMLIRDASRDWSSTATREMTLQIKPVEGRDADADAKRAGEIARSFAGVKDVQVFTREESARFLEPWLGAGLNLADLPVPLLVVLKMDETTTLDVAGLRAELQKQTPGAILDDHRAWVERLDAMANGLVLVALVIVGLVLAAMGLAVAFATRGAMAGNREIIDVLHFVGAADRFIAREFQRHFLRLGLKGGAVGALLAVAAFATLSRASTQWAAQPGGDQVEALFGRFDLGWSGYASMLAIAGMMALLTGFISRSVVYRQLRAMR